ncbi:hypothetical protein AAG570_010473 [Ranatra chinensis]|uniref:Protein singed wings 2 n=1 Tax=Ranatra chinensis TaxID=642074 RepID=A0ABD0Z8R0_9HEMI
MIWILNTNKVTDSESMYCGQMKYFAKPVVAIMEFMNTLEKECPKLDVRRCRCSLDNVVWSQTAEFLIPVTTVNCSYLHLENIPAEIPSNTTILLLNNNNISDLSPIVTNSRYHQVADIYLDNNLVENVDILEGAAWLNNFRVLSFKANNIKALPTYAFDNAFEKNNHAVKVYFGNNPWTCDCTFTPGFKDLLAKHRSLIQDIDDIKCAYIRNDDNSLIKIKELSRNAVCHEDGWLTSLDVLNVILAVLIILLCGKFLYDYWIYKTRGKLPWIAMKLL